MLETDEVASLRLALGVGRGMVVMDAVLVPTGAPWDELGCFRSRQPKKSPGVSHVYGSEVMDAFVWDWVGAGVAEGRVVVESWQPNHPGCWQVVVDDDG